MGTSARKVYVGVCALLLLLLIHQMSRSALASHVSAKRD
jgi:hypothetical protein